MGRLWIALAWSAMLLPLTAAYPQDTTYDETWHEFVYTGIATQGSSDFSQDWPWWEPGIGCTTSVVDFWFELRVEEGSSRDILTIKAPSFFSDSIGVATVDQPALIHANQNDGCEEFVVEGTSVEDEASYSVRVSSTAFVCIPTPCTQGGPWNLAKRTLA